MLLLARDEDGEAMTDAELRDELVTLLVAGHETTATGLAWAFELLLRNPAVLARAQTAVAEGDDRLPRRRGQGDAAASPVDRRASGRVVRGEPFELDGYVIPPGIEINPSIAAIHRRADRYPEPDASSAPSASSATTRPTPTPGSRSAAAPAAAWAPASRSFEMRGRDRAGCSSGRELAGRSAAPRSGVRKGVTIVAEAAACAW